MADKDLNVNINAKVNDDELDPFVKKIDKLEGEKVTVEFSLKGLQDAGELAQRMEKLAQEMETAKRQAQALGQTTVTLRVNADDITTVEQQLGALKGEVTRVDNETIDITVKTENIDGAVQGIRAAGTEAEKLNNQATQAAGGLGQLSAVFGGVGHESINAAQGVLGLSQALENAAASIPALAGMSTAFPLIGTAVAAAVISLGLLNAGILAIGESMVDTEGDTQKFASSLLSLNTNLALTKAALDQLVQDKATEDFFSGLAKGAVAFGAALFTGSLPVGAALFLLRGGLTDVQDAFDTAKERGKEFNDTLKESPQLAARFLEVWKKDGSIPAEELEKYNKQLDEKIAAEIEAKVSGDNYSDTVDTITKAVEAGMEVTTTNIDLLYQQATAYLAAKDATEEADKAAKKLADTQARDAKKAAEDYAESVETLVTDLGNLEDAFKGAKSEADAFSTISGDLGDAAFSVHEAFADDEDAIGKFGEDIKKIIPDLKKQNTALGIGATHLTTFTDAGRKALKATADLAGSVQADLTQSLINSGGNFDAVRERAKQLREEIGQKLRLAGVDTSEIENTFQFLRISEPELEVDIKLTQKKDAANLLEGLIKDLNSDLQHNPALLLQIRLALAQKDPAKGIAELINAYRNDPVVLPAILGLVGTLSPEQQREVQDDLNRMGDKLVLPVNAKPVLNDLPADSVLEIPPGVDLTVPVAPSLVELPPGVDLTIPTTLAPPDTFTPAEKAEIAKNAAVDVHIKPVLDSVGDITGGLTQALELPPGVDLTEGIVLNATVVPKTDAPAADQAKKDADAITKDADGKNRVATIDTAVDTAQATKDLDRWIADQDKKVIVIKVIEQPTTSTGVGSGGGGGGGTGGGTFSAPIQVRQTINAGFGTDRFALERAVRKANRHTERLAGLRR